MLDNGQMRSLSARFVEPVAGRLLKFGITADQVTIVGAVLTMAVSIFFIGTGQFLIGGILVSLLGLSDLIDGTMARLSNTAGSWGAFLDSTLDRLVDGAIYGSLIYWYSISVLANKWIVIALIIGLITAQVTSYTRARWESVGVQGKVGIAERSERMIALCAGLIITGIGINVIEFVIYGLALASTITVFQRILFVRSSLKK